MYRAPRISRRDVLAAGLCCCCAPGLLRQAAAQSGPTRTAEVAAGIHVRRGVDELATVANADAIANVGFIVGRTAVAVVDPGGSLRDGARLRAAIRELTKTPVRYVILSHVHPDHIFGAGAFLQDKPEFIAHARLPAALAQRGEYYRERLEEILGVGQAGSIVQPTMLVQDLTRIDLGGRVLELRAHPPAHTDNDLSVMDLQTRTLFASDLLFVRRAPSLDGSLKGWLQVLSALAALDVQRAVPGHGPTAVNFKDAATELQRYLTALLRETRQAIADGVDIDAAPDAVAQAEKDQWLLFDEYHGHNVVQAYRELEWE